MKKPEFEFESIIYRFEDLTLGQMEMLAAIMHESRKQIFSEMLTGADEALDGAGKPPTKARFQALAMARLTISVADVLHDLRRKGVLCEFVAICMRPKGQAFDSGQVEELSRKFKNLSYDIAETVLTFFFTTGGFAKLLIPDFLAGQPQRPHQEPKQKSRT